jgi:ribosomal protein S18 acetylase RimI-like enzyme
MITPTIRKASMEDFNSIIELSLLFAEFHHNYDKKFKLNWFVSDSNKKWVSSYLQDQEKCLLIALNEENKIIGYLMGSLLAKDDIEHLELACASKVEELFITEPYRSSGLGTNLINSFFDWSREKGAESVYLEVLKQNTRGINFYEKNGFVEYSSLMEAKLSQKQETLAPKIEAQPSN